MSKDDLIEKSRPKDELGAFMDYPNVAVESAITGLLAGKKLAVKDLYDVKGYLTGCGQPGKLLEAETASQNAPLVQKLLDAGANFHGKTLTEEIAFSLNGINHHFGAPVNPKAPDRVTGGSSSGSASAVSAGIVDIATTSDTGGSTRAPASYCGLYGLRPTHGRVSLDGCMPLAPSFDTAGWVTRDAALYKTVGQVVFDEWKTYSRPKSCAIAEDAFSLMDGAARDVLYPVALKLQEYIGGETKIDFAKNLSDWLMVFRTTQGSEIWRNFGEWIRKTDQKFGPGVIDRLEWSAALTDTQIVKGQEQRAQITRHIDDLVAEHELIILPTVPSIAPLKSDPIEKIEEFRNQALSILCVSSMTGVPQMTLPLTSLNGAPLGLSIMTSKGKDELLMDLAVEIEENFELQIA